MENLKKYLTMLKRNCKVMLIFMLEADDRKNIREADEQLGAALYHKTDFRLSSQTMAPSL